MWKFFYLSALIMSFSCCGGGGEQKPAETGLNTALIFGRWEIYEATRSGRPTETLTGGFFEFTPEGKMFTNIGVGSEATFTLDNYQITQQSTPPVIYTIDESTDSTLVLSTELRSLPFVFKLKKALEPPVDSLLDGSDRESVEQ